MNNFKIIKIPVWDLNTNEIIEIEMCQDTLDAMDKSDKDFEDRFNAAMVRDSQAYLYSDQDD